MNPNKVPVKDIVERKFTLRQSGRRYLRGVEHDSLVVDLETNTFHWNSIDLHGNALTWLKEVEGMSYKHSMEFLEKYTGLPFTRSLRKLEEPTPIYPKLLDSFYELGKYHRDYWLDRGLTNETIELYRLGYAGKGIFCIPLFRDSALHNFQCRKSEPKRIWNWASGRGPTLFGLGKGVVADSSYTFIAEGPLDAMVLNQIGLPAISHNGGSGAWSDSWNAKILNFNFIYLIYDNDEAGIKSSKRVSEKLLGRGYVLFWPSFFKQGFDVNDALQTFGAQRTREFIQNVMLTNAVHSSDVKYSEEARDKIDTRARGAL